MHKTLNKFVYQITNDCVLNYIYSLLLRLNIIVHDDDDNDDYDNNDDDNDDDF